jgi:hypothetical protein
VLGAGAPANRWAIRAATSAVALGVGRPCLGLWRPGCSAFFRSTRHLGPVCWLARKTPEVAGRGGEPVLGLGGLGVVAVRM